jgi:hypothetical protein
MYTQKWHDEVVEAMRNQGLPGYYIRRFADELSAHLQDVLQENPLMDDATIYSRLGQPDDLAEHALRTLRQSKFCGRHPLLAFVVLPIPAVLLILATATFGLLCLSKLLPDEWIAENANAFGATAICLMIRFVPFLLASALFCRAAWRAGCSWRWSLVATMLISVLAALFVVNLTLPTHGPNTGRLVMGLAIPPNVGQLPQFLAPLAMAGLIWTWQRGHVMAVTAE